MRKRGGLRSERGISGLERPACGVPWRAVGSWEVRREKPVPKHAAHSRPCKSLHTRGRAKRREKKGSGLAQGGVNYKRREIAGNWGNLGERSPARKPRSDRPVSTARPHSGRPGPEKRTDAAADGAIRCDTPQGVGCQFNSIQSSPVRAQNDPETTETTHRNNPQKSNTAHSAHCPQVRKNAPKFPLLEIPQKFPGHTGLRCATQTPRKL